MRHQSHVLDGFNAGLPQTPRQRLALWGMCMASLLLATALVKLIAAVVGIDVFSILLWSFVPVGAIAVAAVALSGYAAGAQLFRWQGDGWDLLFLMVVCLALQLLMVGVDYLWLLRAQPSLAHQLTFAKFFSYSITSVEYQFNSSSVPQASMPYPQAVGDAGYLLLMPRIGALLAMAKVVHGSVGRQKSY